MKMHRTLKIIIVTTILIATPVVGFRLFGPDSQNVGGDYVLQREPTDYPPFLHWDLREFDQCRIPWSTAIDPIPDLDFQDGTADIADLLLADATFEDAFDTWEAVDPAIVRFLNAGWWPAKGIALDQINLLSFEQADQDDQQCTPVGGAPGAGGVVVSPGADWVLTTTADGDDVTVPCIVDGGDGVAETPAVGDDIQVVAVGAAVPPGCNVIIVPGPNGVLDSAAVFDDQPSFCIVDGGNGTADTTFRNNGFGGGFGDTLGMTGLFFSQSSGVIFEADIVFDIEDIWSVNAHGAVPVEVIIVGPDGDADTTVAAGTDDVQGLPVGANDEPYAVVISPGANGVLDTAPAAGDVVRRTCDLQTVATHEIGHFLGLAHPADHGDNVPPGNPIMNPFYDNTQGSNHVLMPDDENGLNFLYTPDLGDAPDPYRGVFNKFQSLVHTNNPRRMLNNVQLFEPARGPVHLYGNATTRFEWLGTNEDGHASECESRQVDNDLHDDGVAMPVPLIAGAVERITVTIRHSAQAGRYVDGDPLKMFHFNGYMDFAGTGLFGPHNLEVWWSGTPNVPPGATCQTLQSSGNFVPPPVCAANTVTLNFDVEVPGDVADDFWCRWRLDYGEDEGRRQNISGDLAPGEGAAQFGEVEDDPCWTVLDQIHVYPPWDEDEDGWIDVGDNAYVAAQIEADFEPVPGVAVSFAIVMGDLTFSNGEIAPDGLSTTLVTDGDGLAELAFVGTAAGPALLEVSVPGTDLQNYVFFEIHGAESVPVPVDTMAVPEEDADDLSRP